MSYELRFTLGMWTLIRINDDGSKMAVASAHALEECIRQGRVFTGEDIAIPVNVGPG